MREMWKEQTKVSSSCDHMIRNYLVEMPYNYAIDVLSSSETLS
jgi:hypothetical protein